MSFRGNIGTSLSGSFNFSFQVAVGNCGSRALRNFYDEKYTLIRKMIGGGCGKHSFFVLFVLRTQF